MTRPSAGGRIEVICGCMYSGKTEELIRRLHHVQIARQRLAAFTPRRDTRYAAGNLVSHNGVRIEAHIISSIQEVPGHLDEGVQVVALDELHFLDDDADGIRTTCQDASRPRHPRDRRRARPGLPRAAVPGHVAAAGGGGAGRQALRDLRALRRLCHALAAPDRRPPGALRRADDRRGRPGDVRGALSCVFLAS